MSPAALALLSLLGAAPQEEPSRKGSIAAEAEVVRVVLDVRAVDPQGAAIPDLPRSAFRVRVEGREVALEAADWIPAGVARPAAPGEGLALTPSPERPAPAAGTAPGNGDRLFVLFFQTDFTRHRLVGQMRIAHEATRFVDGLGPGDRVAVVSYDSRLKPRLDFTRDREAIRKAVFDSLKTDLPPPLPPGEEPTIGGRIDPDAAARAATVELGLLETARALAEIPGPKWMLYLGWGLRVDRNPQDTPRLGSAIEALYRARVQVFTLDVSDADWHTLETELMVLADLTGGTYAKTHQFARAALDRVFRGVDGRYELVFPLPPGPSGWRDVTVDLVGVAGTVHHRPFLALE